MSVRVYAMQSRKPIDPVTLPLFVCRALADRLTASLFITRKVLFRKSTMKMIKRLSVYRSPLNEWWYSLVTLLQSKVLIANWTTLKKSGPKVGPLRNFLGSGAIFFPYYSCLRKKKRSLWPKRLHCGPISAALFLFQWRTLQHREQETFSFNDSFWECLIILIRYNFS